MMSKKILIIAESINVNDSSGSKVNVALIENLCHAGFDVTVLHYTRKDIQLPFAKCIAIPETKFSLMYILSRTERIFTRLTKINLNPFLEGWFGFSFTFFNDTNSIVKDMRKRLNVDHELIITLSKGASFRPHYALLKIPKLHNKWMAYIHDPYPFHFYPRPYNWIQPGYKQKEIFFEEVSRKAKYSAFPSLLLKDWMASYFINFNKTAIIIPHQNNNYKIQKCEFPLFFDKNKFTLLHAGNLMKQRSPEFLIQAFQQFLKDNPEAKKESSLLLIGPASYHKIILDEYQQSIPELHVEDHNLTFDTVYNLQNNVTVNIILESKSEISPFLPGKFPHCVQANKPILLLAPYYSETKRLLGNNYEFWAEVDDVVKIKTYIKKLYFNWKEKQNTNLNREDIKEYLGIKYLKKEIDSILVMNG